jgi:hypothetical protein
MPTDVAQEKQQVHELIDRLAPSQVTAVRGLLEAMLDPVARALANAPFDDEPLTDAERRAVAEADEWLKHNQPIPHEEVLAEFGMTTADWEKMADEPLTEEPPHRNG